jgi:hypothetical protein
MATLREYYEKDFSHSTRVFVKVPINSEFIDGTILYDFAGFFAFMSLYVPGTDKKIEYFIDILSQLKYGTSQLSFGGRITLPAAKEFPGQLMIKNKKVFEILAQYFGDTEWISTKNFQSSRRVFIYSETDMSKNEVKLLKEKAKELGHDLQFRAERFRAERSKQEKPLAFISHDFRDKALIARPIAFGLQRHLIPVWYDEFSLPIGAKLRESIESGIKETKKCILIVTRNFINNQGWTKVEFDAVFTKEIYEKGNVLLPVWHEVTAREVYDYSSWLANITAVNWNEGEDEVIRKLHREIMK